MKNKMIIYMRETIPDGISQHCLAYSLLEKMLTDEKIAEPPEKGFCYRKDRYGKPYLENVPYVQFNISHCQSGVVCCAAEEAVGIDVERRFPWKEKLAEKICHDEEKKMLERLKPEQRAAALNLLWSRKESYLKCVGTGLRVRLSELNFSTLPPTATEKLHLSGTCSPCGSRTFSKEGHTSAAGGKLCCFYEAQTEAYTLVACSFEKTAVIYKKIPSDRESAVDFS